MESCTQSHDNAMATTTRRVSTSRMHIDDVGAVRMAGLLSCYMQGRVWGLTWKSAVVTMYATRWIRWFYGAAKTVVSLSTLLYMYIHIRHSLSMLLKWIRRLRFVFCFETFLQSCFVYKWRTKLTLCIWILYISLLQHFRRLLLLFYKR